MRHLCIVLFSFLLSTSIFAQQNNSLTELHATKVINLKFEKIPNSEVIKDMSKQGITLNIYMGNLSYQASVRQKVNLAELSKEYRFTHLSDRNVDIGLLKDIEADYIPESARHDDGTVDLAITFSTELSETDRNTFLNQNDGRQINSFSNGQVLVCLLYTSDAADDTP